jgi:hypothetical protein
MHAAPAKAKTAQRYKHSQRSATSDRLNKKIRSNPTKDIQ